MLNPIIDSLAGVSQNLYRFLHRNVPQLLVFMVMANVTICIWGRGTGKTFGATAGRAYHNATVMPRSVGAIGCMSYAHLIDVMLREIVGAWTDMGLVEGVHFWVRKFPPPELKVPRALKPLQDPSHAIFFCNGSAIKLFSVNFQSLKNSDSVDWMIFEEARLLKYDKVKEMLKCRRGNLKYFSHRPEHLSLLIITDMPPDKNSEWLFTYREHMNDALIQYIIELEQQISLRYWEQQKTKSQKRKEQLQREMDRFREEANACRKEAVYVSYATSLDNLHALGHEVIRGYIRDSASQLDAQVSILSRRPAKVPRCFYPWLDEKKHLVDGTNFEYIRTVRRHEARNWRWDADLDTGQPLDICLDYNAVFSSMVVGQANVNDVGGDNYHFLKNLYVEHPATLRMLVKKFCQYYDGFPVNIVNYYYDQTATGEDAQKRKVEGETFDEIVVRELEDNGWEVNRLFVGQTWGHKQRYDEINNMMLATADAPFTLTFNEENCAELIEACQGAGVKITVKPEGSETRKDKDSEKPKSNIPPVKATHLTEAMDGLLYGRVYYPPSIVSSFVGIN